MVALPSPVLRERRFQPRTIEAEPRTRGRVENDVARKVVKAAAGRRIVFDSAIMCTFPMGVIGMESASRLLSAVTGQDLDVPKLAQIGERTLNMERLFISKAGFGRADDRLPSRLLDEPMPDGPNRGKVVPMEALKDEFYGSCGWDPETGFPKTETLERLGIELRP